MKNKFALVSVVLLSALVLTGCVPTPEPAPTTAPTEAPVPTGEPTEVPMPDATAQLAEAQDLFPNAAAVGKFSKEDVQLALLTSYKYAYDAFNQAYFVSGKFAADNYKEENYNSLMRKYFSAAGYTRFFDSFTQINSGDQAAREEGIKFLLRNTFIVSLDGSTYAPSPECSTGTTDCLTTPLEITGIKYDVTDDGRLRVSYKVTGATTFYDPSGASIVTTREYDVVLALVKNTEALVETDYQFVIDETNNAVKGS